MKRNFKRNKLLRCRKYGFAHNEESITKLYKKYNLYHHIWNDDKKLERKRKEARENSERI